MTHADLARAWAARVRIEARRPGVSLGNQLAAEIQAKALEDFSRVLDGAVPEAEDDSITPPAGTPIPQAATQLPAGAPPSVLEKA